MGKLHEDEQAKMKSLEQNLAKKVIGQEEAVTKVAKAIRRSRAGLKSKTSSNWILPICWSNRCW